MINVLNFRIGTSVIELDTYTFEGKNNYTKVGCLKIY